jgi:hypothetical protein
MDKTPCDRHRTRQKMVERPRGIRAMPKTLAEKHGYKGVEYGVQPDGPGKWKWAIYPQIRGGIAQKRGRVSGTREDAVAECKAAIEKAFQKRALR